MLEHWADCEGWNQRCYGDRDSDHCRPRNDPTLEDHTRDGMSQPSATAYASRVVEIAVAMLLVRSVA